MSNRIENAFQFLKETFNNSEYLLHHIDERNELLEHSCRVANIGSEIAGKENLNQEAVIVGCLLHDISYCMDSSTGNNWINHGKNSAVIARPFLSTLNFSTDIIDEICYGISSQADDASEYASQDTLLSKTIREANKIDHLDVSRIYENLYKIGFNRLNLLQKEERINILLSQLEHYRIMEFSTKTSKGMWKERVEFQISFYIKMALHLKNSQLI